MPVDLPGAGEELLELPEPHGAGGGQADRRPDREAPADPVPHGKDFGRAELPCLRFIRRYRNELLLSVEPISGSGRIGDRFLSREGLRHHDEKRRHRVGAFEGAAEVARIGVGGEAHVERVVA